MYIVGRAVPKVLNFRLRLSLANGIWDFWCPPYNHIGKVGLVATITATRGYFGHGALDLESAASVNFLLSPIV